MICRRKLTFVGAISVDWVLNWPSQKIYTLAESYDAFWSTTHVTRIWLSRLFNNMRSSCALVGPVGANNIIYSRFNLTWRSLEQGFMGRLDSLRLEIDQPEHKVVEYLVYEYYVYGARDCLLTASMNPNPRSWRDSSTTSRWWSVLCAGKR